MNKIAIANLIINFVQFKDFIIGELWIDLRGTEKYKGEIIISMN